MRLFIRLLISTMAMTSMAGGVSAQEGDPAASPAADEPPATELTGTEPTTDAPLPAEEDSPQPDTRAGQLDANSRHGLFGPFRIGPTAAAVIPHIANVSIEVLWADTFSGGISFGRFKSEMSDIEFEIRNWDLRGRWHPFGGSFFLGAAYGSQGLVAKFEDNLETTMSGLELEVPTTLRLGVDTNYLTPHLGWFAVWDSGFTMGFEIGYQMALSSDSELQVAFKDTSTAQEDALKISDEYKKNKKDVEDLAESLGKTGVPYITLLRLGWLL